VKHTILLPGTATDKIRHRLTSSETVSTLEEAINIAYSKAKPGDVVVLSPAAANFFTKYGSGKEGFTRIVKRLKSRK